MKELIKKIAKLPKLEKWCFIRTLLDSGEDAVTDLMGTLKRYGPRQREAFIKAMPETYGNWIGEQLEKTTAADDKTASRVGQKITAALITAPANAKRVKYHSDHQSSIMVA